MGKPGFLRKKGTNEIHVYTDNLFKRGDMIPCERDGQKDESGDEENPNKIQLIVEAISKLEPGDYGTSNGLPKCDALSESVGSDVKAAERNEAWEIFNKEGE